MQVLPSIHDLWLLTISLSQQTNEERTLQMFVEALNAKQQPPVFRFSSEKPTPVVDETILEVATRTISFGWLICNTPSLQESPNAAALIHNAAQMLAIILENQKQKRLLADEKLHLEEAVQQRTEELEETNQELLAEIIEHTRAEKELQHWKLTFDNAEWGVVVVGGKDHNGQYLQVNPAYARMHGYTIDELVGQPVQLVYTQESQREITTLHQQVLTKGYIAYETIHQRKDGSQFPVWVNVTAVWDEQGGLDYFVVNVEDISERKQIETAMFTSQKMADLGTLAAGIAHELNSPLQVITWLTERMQQVLKQDEPDKAQLLDDTLVISRNAWRVAHIIRSLLSYARPSLKKTEPHNLNLIIDDTLLLIQHRLKTWSNILIEKKLDENLPEIACDQNDISQVLINLLTNAADAMPDGGTIRIQTSYDQTEKSVNLTITDTGSGISEENLKRIFDPFFTTKPVGKGTGLGLSISQGIIKAHNGSIKVRSTLGKGTTFTVHIPTDPSVTAQTPQNHVTGRYDIDFPPSIPEDHEK